MRNSRRLEQTRCGVNSSEKLGASHSSECDRDGGIAERVCAKRRGVQEANGAMDTRDSFSRALSARKIDAASGLSPWTQSDCAEM